MTSDARRVVIEWPDGQRRNIHVEALTDDEAATAATAGEPEGTRVIRIIPIPNLGDWKPSA